MNAETIKQRIRQLLNSPGESEAVHGMYQATITVMQSLYGPNSAQEKDLRNEYSQIVKSYTNLVPAAKYEQQTMLKGVLANMESELDSGFVGTLTAGITGEVLTDFLKLSRAALDSSTDDDAKNVGAVLASAAFEDSIRRVGALNGVPHFEKLADLLIELKNQNILKGAQVGIAQSYLKFRNSAMHAKWAEIDRASVHSVLGFTEQLILSHFV